MRKYILLFLFTLLFKTASSQNPVPNQVAVDSLIRTISELRKDIKQLRQENIKINKSIERNNVKTEFYSTEFSGLLAHFEWFVGIILAIVGLISFNFYQKERDKISLNINKMNEKYDNLEKEVAHTIEEAAHAMGETRKAILDDFYPNISLIYSHFARYHWGLESFSSVLRTLDFSFRYQIAHADISEGEKLAERLGTIRLSLGIASSAYVDWIVKKTPHLDPKEREKVKGASDQFIKTIIEMYKYGDAEINDRSHDLIALLKKIRTISDSQ